MHFAFRILTIVSLLNVSACDRNSDQRQEISKTETAANPKHEGGKVWIRLPSALTDAVRSERYDGPLGAALAKEGWGEILEGDSVKNADGTVSYVTLIVGLVPGADLEGGLEFVQRVMGELGAPYETQYISYPEKTGAR